MADGDPQRPLTAHGLPDESVGELPLDYTRVLGTQYVDTVGQIRAADRKAQLILGINALLLGLFGSADLVDALRAGENVGLGAVLSTIALVAALVSVTDAALVIIPRKGKAIPVDRPLFFGWVASHSEDEFLERYLGLTMEEMRRALLVEIHATSIIAAMKYRWARRSANALVAALMLWGISALIGG